MAPVRLAFAIDKDKAHFRLVGRVQTTLTMPCSRCVEPFSFPVDATFDLRYQPRTENSGEPEREIEEDDLTTAFYENDTIDLGDLMREQFYLALPMKPLCRDDCRGLCPTCGANLNRETCDCTPVWEDPRLVVLKTLKKSRRIAGDSQVNFHAESKTTTFEDADGQAPHARRAEAGRPRRVPALPRAEAAAPRLLELRVLPRTPGSRD